MCATRTCPDFKKEIIDEGNAAGGKKNDSGKLDYTLLPWEVIEALVKRFSVGKNKYGPWNWTKVEKDRYEAAMLRHFVEYKKGKVFDEDPNFEGNPSTHLQAALWNCFVLAYFELKELETSQNEEQ